MQKISHSTRAYIANADGLKGFISSCDIIEHLKEANEAGLLDHAKKYQAIDLNTVEKELANKATRKLKMIFLAEEYPSLFVYMLGLYGKKDKIQKYMAKCKTFENNRDKYSIYIHGYLLIWLQ